MSQSLAIEHRGDAPQWLPKICARTHYCSIEPQCYCSSSTLPSAATFPEQPAAEGWVTRQIVLQGPELTPIAAASLAEWQQAHEAGRLFEYDNRFGMTAELPVSEWEGHDPEELTAEEFEEVWDTASRQIPARPL